MTFLKKFFNFFRSKKLALALMIAILVSIIAGTVFLPEPVGRKLVFRALWFNALLVLLVLNTAFCFFGRLNRSTWDIAFTGAVIFHLSFVAMCGGVIIDSLFSYRGALRLTEGEAIAINDPNAYDEEYWGRFFKHEWMRGTIIFKKLHTRHMVGNKNKGVANEIAIAEGNKIKEGIIYTTSHLSFNGFKLLRNKDGFAPLFVLYDRQGSELYGAYTSLQSFKQEDGTYLYVTGEQEKGVGSADFPQIEDIPPLFRIQFTYQPPKRRADIQKASFKVWEYDQHKENRQGRLVFDGAVPLGQKAIFDDYALSMNEVRYWASMDVLYTPGQPVILASFWIGLGGLVMTTIARFARKR